MMIQQHNGVVVDAAVNAAGLRRASARGRGVAGEREAPRLEVRLPSLPPLYRPPRGGAGPGDEISQGGGGQGGWSAPQGKWRRPLP